MSIETLLAIAEAETEAEGLEEAEADDTFINLAPGPVEVSTKKLGRPGIHSKEGRVYFLRDEVKQIRNNPEEFVSWMKATYTPSDNRLAELAEVNLAMPTNEISYTLHGPILEVLARAEEIVSLYSDRDVTFEISKQKLVPPTNALYSQPITEMVKTKSKITKAITFQEFSPEVIYVYLTIR